MALSGLTLAMDAAAGNGTIAVFRDWVLVAEADVVMRSEREERFFPAVLATLERAGVTLAAVDRVVAGAGPGSFTALRVVGATAKGIAQARGIALFGVPSLALMHPSAAGDGVPAAGATRWLATLDALRGDRYAALVERDAHDTVTRVEPLGVVPITELAARADALAATLLGPDEARRAFPHAKHSAGCAALIAASGPVDLASWEPAYGRLAEAQVKWEAAQGRPLT